MANAMYIRMRRRSTAMIKDKGGLYSWKVGGVIGRDDEGNEVEESPYGESSGWAVLTKLDSKVWGADRNPNEAQLIFAPVGKNGSDLKSFQKDMVISSIAGMGSFRVVESKPIMPDGETLIAINIKVVSL